MSNTPPERKTRKRSRLRRWLTRLTFVFGALVIIGAALPYGCVGNRMYNPSPEDYLRTFSTAEGLPYAVAIVEFDDQGEPWDLRQLEAVTDLIRRLNRTSEHGVLLFQFIHGWKSNASRTEDSGARLAWFQDRIADIARRSGSPVATDPRGGRPVVGLYIGWRGRTYSLPVLIEASFWNRRVAAHRVSSIRLIEVLLRSANAAAENPDSKCVLIGHSMGGMVLEKTLAPALVDRILAVERQGGSAPLEYDLILSANPSTEALYSKQLIDVLRRSQVRLVLEDDAGNRTAADGPLMASITSEADLVTRRVVPFAMNINSIFVRYRGYSDPSMPTQREFGVHTSGHVRFLHSHAAEVRDGEPVLRELPGRWNDTSFWIFQVPPEISRNHVDIDNPIWWRLVVQLMDANQVFNPDLELRLAEVPSAVPDAY
jgi:hypothetical protein